MIDVSASCITKNPIATIKVSLPKYEMDSELGTLLNQLHQVEFATGCCHWFRFMFAWHFPLCHVKITFVFFDKVRAFSKCFDSPSIALRKGMQLEAEVLDPKITAYTKQYKSLTRKPKAPVKSWWIFGNLKQALMSASSKERVASEKLTLMLYHSQ